jgi:hypothetical protein
MDWFVLLLADSSSFMFFHRPGMKRVGWLFPPSSSALLFLAYWTDLFMIIKEGLIARKQPWHFLALAFTLSWMAPRYLPARSLPAPSFCTDFPSDLPSGGSFSLPSVPDRLSFLS